MDLCTNTDDLYDLHSFAGDGRVPHAEDFIRTSKQIGCPTLMRPQDLTIRTSVKVLHQLVLDATQIPRPFDSNIGRPSHLFRHPSTRGAGLHAPGRLLSLSHFFKSSTWAAACPLLVLLFVENCIGQSISIKVLVLVARFFRSN